MIKLTKLNIRLYLAILLVLVGCGLLIAGFIVSPLGEIHNSILLAFGELALFIGALLGIDMLCLERMKRYFDILSNKLK